MTYNITPAFNKSEFHICYVPVPKGCPQSQTHVGCLVHNGKVYLTSTPYPRRHYPKVIASILYRLNRLLRYPWPKLMDEYYENPCLYVCDIGGNSSLATNFKPYIKNPLMSTPERVNGLPSYNSDPDLSCVGNHLFILNRAVYRTKITKSGYDSYKRIYLIDVDLKEMSHIRTTVLKEWETPCISPCLFYYNNKYILAYLDSNAGNDFESFYGLYYIESSSIEGLKLEQSIKTIRINSDRWIPWHMSIFEYKGKLFSVVNCALKGQSGKLWQLLGEFSNNLEMLIIYPFPLSDYNSYRSSAFVDNGGNINLYLATVNEDITDGTSIDGREILVAKRSFDEVLHRCKGEKV